MIMFWKKQMKQNKVYMYVTDDKYELPLAVADTQAELAKLTHTTQNAISSSISHAKSRNGKSQYIEVSLDETKD